MADDPQTNDDEPNSKVVVINECYCTQKSQNFIVKKKLAKYQTISFEVFDADQNLLLQAQGRNCHLHRTFILKDSQDSPVATLHEARLTDKHRWEVYEGDSTDAPDFLFKVQRTTTIQVKARLDVLFMDTPSSEENRFQLKEEELTSHTASIYQGQTVIARIEHKHTWKDVLRGKDELKVEVCEGVDYAFVMAILVIMVMLTDR